MSYKSQGRDLSVGMIRFISMIFIVFCHFLQFYEKESAWWLNIGVQIFLCISGFLYAKKEITDDVAFISNTFKKILIPFYLYIFSILPFYFLFFNGRFLMSEVGYTLFLSSRLPGLEHLWYVPYILLCYLFTPLLSEFCKKIHEFKNSKFVIVLFLTVAIIDIFLISFTRFLNAAWVSLYVTSYLISYRLFHNKITMKNILTWLVPLCLVSTSFRIYFTYFFSVSSTAAALIVNKGILYSRACLGITLFFALYVLFNKINLDRVFTKKIIFLSDKYSYTIYLTHHIYILGPFGIMTFFSSSYLNILFATILIVISGWLLKTIESGVKRLSSSRFS